MVPRYVFLLIIGAFCFSLSVKADLYGNLTERDDSVIINKLNGFRMAMQDGNPSAAGYNDFIMQYLESEKITDTILLSDCYYYTGTYSYIQHLYPDAINLLNKSINYRLASDSIDDIYARARTNLALSFMYTGNPDKARQNLEDALLTREGLFGTDSPSLLRTLLNLSAIYLDLGMNERALSYSLRGVRIASENSEHTDRGILANLYHNSGASYVGIQDYTRAIQNFELMLSMTEQSDENIDLEQLVRSYNSLAACNYELGNAERSDYYFREALKLADMDDIPARLLIALYENYAFLLADMEELDSAEHYFLLSVDLSRDEFGDKNRDHLLQLISYSYFLMQYRQDYNLADSVFMGIRQYINERPEDSRVRTEAYLFYSSLLYRMGRYNDALQYIDMVIGDSLVVPSGRMTTAYLQKGRTLFEIYRSDNDLSKLEEALSVAEKAIRLIEDTRLRIQFDESRSRISGRYMDAYDIALAILYEMLQATADDSYAERALMISEKSKAAGLLAATRNNRTMNFQLPENLARKERNLLADIRDYSEAIYNESAEPDPDIDLIAYYRQQSIRSAASYDSLVLVFRKDYPRYYNLRHNTAVSGVEDILGTIGRNGNFIEYHLSDSLLYIFLVNRKQIVLEAVSSGDDLKKMILEFRDIITKPVIVNGAKLQYQQFISLSNGLYEKLILPVKDYLISDHIIISADDLILYIPFETLISKLPDYSEINYRDLAFLLNEFEIVYEYSGTIMSEMRAAHRSIQNNVLTFAPRYEGGMSVQDLMTNRQTVMDNLTNIPGAREEAIYINKLLGGDLFIDEAATEQAFKTNANDGDIIHLAMHTVINDADPMYSKMIFTISGDTVEDGLLNTYEVYNIPFDTKMMFLSSCNTGSGYLQSGEGVMSLARGFFYSGSPCVIMSLWEVDDHSGSDIVKAFYDGLKKGLTKSKALSKARNDYLQDADQMRSHPYFWSTLVIMGNNESVYLPFKRYLLIALVLIIIATIARYYYRSGI